jgi:hypothetical protein
MTSVGVPHWDFWNVVPEKTGDVKMEDVDWDKLWEVIGQRKAVVCLGGFVARVAKRAAMYRSDPINLIFIDHPSPRNRNFNDPAYEPEMLTRLKKELKDVLGS